MRPTNDVRCEPFSETSFCDEVWSRSSGHPPPAKFTPRQVAYLATHLKRLGAASLLIESYYVDRHYIEEVGLYYSKCLGFGQSACARIHAFASLGERRDLHANGRLDELLCQASTEGASAVENLLNPAYLGYVVVRPQASVPIGRTILRPPPSRGRRWVQAQYGAHVLGLSLRVEGLAFQQQDRAVGACATTAAWTALQKTCKRESDRPPTPSAITQAAVRYAGPVGRVLPSGGLNIAQICEAFRSFDFPPDVIGAEDVGPELFKILLNIYLRSDIPVLLATEGPAGGHAVTVVGFGSEGRKVPTYSAEERTIESINLGFETIYLHDDRIGPYTRAEIAEEKGEPGGKSELILNLWDHGRIVEKSVIRLAAAPLYPKLRSAAIELLDASFYLLPVFEHAFAAGGRLRLELFFQRSGDYMTDLYSTPADALRLSNFQQRIALSRYVGISRWYLGDQLLLDAIWDTTDTLREETMVDQFWLGMVAFRAADFATVDTIASRVGVVSG